MCAEKPVHFVSYYENAVTWRPRSRTCPLQVHAHISAICWPISTILDTTNIYISRRIQCYKNWSYQSSTENLFLKAIFKPLTFVSQLKQVIREQTGQKSKLSPKLWVSFAIRTTSRVLTAVRRCRVVVREITWHLQYMVDVTSRDHSLSICHRVFFVGRDRFKMD